MWKKQGMTNLNRLQEESEQDEQENTDRADFNSSEKDNVVESFASKLEHGSSA